MIGDTARQNVNKVGVEVGSVVGKKCTVSECEMEQEVRWILWLPHPSRCDCVEDESAVSPQKELRHCKE